MRKLLSFNEVLGSVNNPKLLLGNGFSIAYDKERFSFTSLLDSAVNDGIITKNGEIHQIFQLLETSDFESVMRLLEQSKVIIQVYNGEKGMKENIDKDLSNLKDYLIRVITNNHPEKSVNIPVEKKIACANFLKLFECIYTLNYDLLLYRAIMQDENATKKFNDGFGEDEENKDEKYVTYKNSHGSKILYLHGALHLFDAGDKILKETYCRTDISLMIQIRENLDKGIYPIFVSEGDNKQKMTKILHSGYLSVCYRSLKNIGGNLIIFGTYLKANDNHILDAIIDSKVENIYIGVSKEENINHIIHRIDEYNKNKSKRQKEKRLFLYDYKTINPREYEE